MSDPPQHLELPEEAVEEAAAVLRANTEPLPGAPASKVIAGAVLLAGLDLDGNSRHSGEDAVTRMARAIYGFEWDELRDEDKGLWLVEAQACLMALLGVVTSASKCSHAHLHTDAPSGYLQWHAWAERKAKTHKQERCPGCGLWAIWRRR